MRRFWTDDEREALRAEYGKTPTTVLAGRLGRTGNAVHQEAAKQRIVRRRVVTDEAFDESIRRMNAAGYPDQEIASVIGCERHTVARHRNALGLPSQARSHRYVARVKEATRKQCAAVGVDSVGALRSLVFRLRSVESGWGEGLRPRHVQILDLLSERGPMTRRQIAEALGMPWKGSRKSLVSNDPEGSYLAHLMKRGLVVGMGRLVRGDGRGKSVNLYCLAMATEKDHESGAKIFGPGLA